MDIRDNKLPEPLAHGSISTTKTTKTKRINFRRDDPRETVRTEGPENRVEHDHGSGSSATLFGGVGNDILVGRMTDFDVSTNVGQAKSTGDRRDHPRLPSTPHVDEIDVEDDGADSLDQAIDTGVKIDVGDTEGAKQGGGIIVDGVGTCIA